MGKKASIVGASSTGLVAAGAFALAGFDVDVYERLSEEDSINLHQWSDAVELDLLDDVGLPTPTANGDYFEGPGVRDDEDAPYGEPEKLYENHRITQLAAFSPDYSHKVLTDADFRYIFVDRISMNKVLKTRAENLGAKIHYKSTVSDLFGNLEGDLEDIEVKGLIVDKDGVDTTLASDLVVDASGQFSTLRTSIKNEYIGEPHNPALYATAFRTTRKFSPARVNESKAPYVEHFRSEPGKGFIFVHYHSDDIIDIGGGVASNYTFDQLKDWVYESVHNYPQIDMDAERRTGTGKILQNYPPKSMVANGYMVVGHAVPMVIPNTGCGIAAGWSGALLAAQVAKSAVSFGLESLWPYNKRWLSGRGGHAAALLVKRAKGGAFTADDINILMENNIMNGSALSRDYQGIFLDLTTDEMRRLESFREKYKGLADMWEASYKEASEVLNYYKAFPETWNKTEFEKWAKGRETKFVSGKTR
jgi:flavin-dependent dehydrogenase